MKIFYLLLFCCVTINSSSAQTDTKKASNTGVDPRITEVFADQIDLVLNEPQRLKDLNALFLRYEVITAPAEKDEKYIKLSSVRLFDNYNPNLKRDAVFNKDTFNILKYDMRFFAPFDIVYRVDDTDYLIVIHPQNLRK